MSEPSQETTTLPPNSTHRVAGSGLQSGQVFRLPSADEVNGGRKSGRLREKGPTTYTAKGDIIRGGKRVNEEIHGQSVTKRVRYET